MENQTDVEVPLSKTAISEFQDLVQANLDSFNVLTEIADRMNDPVYSESLRQIAVRRARNAEDLKHHLRLQNAQPATVGTLCGMLHQIWIDCRAAINAGDSYVMLLEAEKAEAVIHTAYETAVAHLSKPATLSHVLEQHGNIRKDSATISEHRESLKRVRQGFASPEDHP